jgi:CBS domain-containing protein
MVSAQLDTFLSTPVSAFVRLDVPRVRLNTDLKKLGEEYRSTPLNCVLLTNKDGKLAGLLDDNAISRISELQDPLNATAFDLLQLDTTPLAAVKLSGQMWEALQLMNGGTNINGGRRVDVIPVVGDDGTTPIGVISRADLALKSVANNSNLPPASGQFTGSI